MIEIIAGIISAVAGVTAVLIMERTYYYSLRKKRAARREVSSGERIHQSISKLSGASQEIDAIIQDIVKDIRRRQTMMEELKARHQTLSQEESELSKRVEMLNINCCIHLSSGQKRFPLFERALALKFKPQNLILEPRYFQI